MDSSVFNGLGKALHIMFVFAIIGVAAIAAGIIALVVWLCLHLSVIVK